MKSLFEHFEILENPRDIRKKTWTNEYFNYDNLWNTLWLYRLC